MQTSSTAFLLNTPPHSPPPIQTPAAFPSSASVYIPLPPQQSNHITLNLLPAEVLLNILTHLKSSADLVRVGATCRDFAGLVQESYKGQYLQFIQALPDLSREILEASNLLKRSIAIPAPHTDEWEKLRYGSFNTSLTQQEEIVKVYITAWDLLLQPSVSENKERAAKLMRIILDSLPYISNAKNYAATLFSTEFPTAFFDQLASHGHLDRCLQIVAKHFPTYQGDPAHKFIIAQCPALFSDDWNECSIEEGLLKNNYNNFLACSLGTIFNISTQHPSDDNKLRMDKIFALLKKLFKQGCDLEETDQEGITVLLHTVAYTRERSPYLVYLIVTLLLEQGANYNATDNEGNTPLIWACRHENDELVFPFLQYRDLNINASNNKGETALYTALITAGQAVSNNKGGTTLHITAAKKINALLHHPHIDVNVVDQNGRSLFDCAASFLQFKIVRALLLDPRFDKKQLNQNKLYLLFAAIEFDHVEAVQSLLQTFQESNIENITVRINSFLYAIWHEKEEIINIFLTSLTSSEKSFLLDMSLGLFTRHFASPIDFNIATKRLVALGADINTQITHWGTALMRAGMEEQEELILFLLQQPNIDLKVVKYRKKSTVLHLAIKYKKLRTLNILLNDNLLNKSSLEFNITDALGRNKLLEKAVINNRLLHGRKNRKWKRILKVLLDNITNPTARVSAFNTALMTGQADLVRFFLWYINPKDRLLFTLEAYRFALSNKQENIKEDLRSLYKTQFILATMPLSSWLISIEKNWLDPIRLLLKQY
jgi:ankyrin repeat protein